MSMHSLYRFFAYIKHYLTAFNTGGEGIHSPYLFYIVRMLMYDNNGYYIWQNIEKCRYQMLSSSDTIDVLDLGTGNGRQSRRRVKDIAATSIEEPRIAQLMFRLILFLSQNSVKPLNILELGTNLGITTAYLAAADKRNSVTTMEGSRSLLDLAEQNHRHLNINNIKYIVGNIDEQLPRWTAKQTNKYRSVDFAFIDANHTYEATMRYFNELLPLVGKKSILVIDDIYHSPEMTRAWLQIKSDSRITTTMDLYRVGLVFFDKDYIHRHYRLRY